jgi:peptide/nickel transport system substrate-binding protein
MKKRVLAVLCVMAIAVGSLTGCGKNGSGNNNGPTKAANEKATPSPVPDASTGTDLKYSEAPSLTEKVKAGTLPSVEERLPAKDKIMVEYMDSIGTYGEAFNFTFKGKDDKWWYGKITEEPLFRFKTDSSIEPNVAESYEVNEDSTVYTIHLREGIKWSDGVDFTTDDVLFFYNEMCVKESFGKSLWDCFKVVDETGKETTAEFKAVDKYTFTVTFKAPKPNFLKNLTIEGKWCFAPKHWYENILPDIIGEEAAETKAKEMGYADVESMGKETGYYYWNVPGRPTLRPWVVTKENSNNQCDGKYFIMERNPYYWKIDEKGQQLPYEDELRFTKISDDQQTTLKVLDGSTSFTEVQWPDYDTLYEGQESGGYELLEWATTYWAADVSQLQLNQTVKDKKKRELFQNIDFRQALSVAVDRENFAEIVSNGFAKGKQASPDEGTPGYNEEWTKQWTEYSTDNAKKLLEKCGLVMSKDGYYDFADGTDFVLNISTYTDAQEHGVDKAAELIMADFKKAGIKTTYKPVSRELLDNMTISNDHEAILDPIVSAETVNIALRPDSLIPVRNYAAWYGTYGDWYASKGKDGLEPTGDIKQLCNLLDQLRTASNAELTDTIAQKMLDLHHKNQWVIGYMKSLPSLIAKKKNIKNFAEKSIYCDEYRGLGVTHLATCYFEK